MKSVIGLNIPVLIYSLFICHDIQIRWKVDDSHKKKVLEMAAKMWRDFKVKLNKNFILQGKDPCELYNFISQDQWEIFKKTHLSDEFKVKS